MYRCPMLSASARCWPEYRPYWGSTAASFWCTILSWKFSDSIIWNVNLYETGRVGRNTLIKVNGEKLIPHLTGSLYNDLKSFKTFFMHPTTEGVYGPGSCRDKSFTPVPQDRKWLLKWLVSQAPGFTNDQKVLDDVKFEGDDLPSIPGPAKSVALTAVFHAMAGIVGQENSEMRRHKAGQPMINTNHVGLWLGTLIIVTLNGKGAVLAKLYPSPIKASSILLLDFVAGLSIKPRR